MHQILPSPFARATGRGFTLIEVVMSLAVFLIIMLALSSTFAQLFTGYRNTRALQKDVESAQFAFNLMAKELRTSTIVVGSSSSVTFFNYSQDKCFRYIIDSGNKELTVEKTGAITRSTYFDVSGNPSTFNPTSACNSVPFLTTAVALVKIENTTTGSLSGKFVIVPSTKSPKKIGKITVSLHISEGPNNEANVQTTSSLRDYGYVGLIGN